MTKAKRKNKFNKLEWNVLMRSLDRNKLEVYNVLREDLLDDIEKLIKKPYTREDLERCVKIWGRHHYWSKVEYEVVIRDMFDHFEEKIDVWKQIEINFDRLMDYLIKELELLD